MTQETEYLNLVIRGKIQFRKCPNCDVEGRELQCYDCYGEPCSHDDPNVNDFNEFCEDCDGLAFIEIPHDLT